MKMLTERTEIAKALNFGKYPVLTLDLKNRDEYGFEGCKVRVDCGAFRDGMKNYEHATLRVYSDEKTFKISAGATFLKAGFGYSDVAEMLEYANAPIIKTEQEIVIVIIDSEKHIAYPPYLIMTGKKIDQFCMTPIQLEKVDLSYLF